MACKTANGRLDLSVLLRRESEAAKETAEKDSCKSQAALHESEAALRAAEAALRASEESRRVPEAQEAAMVEELNVLRGEDEELRKISKIIFRAREFRHESDLNLSRARTRGKIISSSRQ